MGVIRHNFWTIAVMVGGREFNWVWDLNVDWLTCFGDEVVHEDEHRVVGKLMKSWLVLTKKNCIQYTILIEQDIHPKIRLKCQNKASPFTFTNSRIQTFEFHPFLNIPSFLFFLSFTSFLFPTKTLQKQQFRHFIHRQVQQLLFQHTIIKLKPQRPIDAITLQLCSISNCTFGRHLFVFELPLSEENISWYKMKSPGSHNRPIIKSFIGEVAAF